MFGTSTDLPHSLHPLIAVVGPTGSGKSDLALRIAEEFNGEIVNCDSLQIFRYFNIATAKLDVSERRGVPHHLIDIVNPEANSRYSVFAQRVGLGRLCFARKSNADPVAAGRNGSAYFQGGVGILIIA